MCPPQPLQSFDTAEGFAQHRAVGSHPQQGSLGHGHLARGAGRSRLRPDRVADLRGGVLQGARAAARQPERYLPARPHADGIRHRGAESAHPAEDGQRRGSLGAGLVRAQCRFRHGGDPLQRAAGRGQVHYQRPEDLVDPRGLGGLVFRHVSHRSAIRSGITASRLFWCR